MKPRFLTLAGMIAAAAVARIFPHPWNVSPVAAMALFGGAEFEDKPTAFLVPFLAMAISDCFIGFHALMAVVYACFAVTVCIGFWIKKNPGVGRILSASLAASILFYVVTNFAMWTISPLYAKTMPGLMGCYVAAIPFFRNTVLGDLFYTGVLFGAFQLVSRSFPVLRQQAS